MKVFRDPLKHYSHIPTADLVDSCGLIPHWVVEWSQQDDLELWPYLQQRYGFPTSHLEDAQITPEGQFTFPGDPPLHPLLRIEHRGTTFWQYPYGLVAVRTPTATHITRMD